MRVQISENPFGAFATQGRIRAGHDRTRVHRDRVLPLDSRRGTSSRAGSCAEGIGWALSAFGAAIGRRQYPFSLQDRADTDQR